MSIIHMIKSKFSLKINGETKNYIEMDYNKNNIIELENILIEEKELKNFKNYTLKKNNNKILKEDIITLEKSKMSFYFDDITFSDKSEKNFKLVLDKNRLRLMDSINKFLNSDNLFYLIMGTEGIGKTITLLYFSSFLQDYKILYLNLKLIMTKKSKEKNIDEIFFNELKRLFFTDNEKLIKKDYFQYERLKNEIKIYINNNNKSFEKMRQEWKLLFGLLDTYSKILFEEKKVLIILDQYKCNEIDEDYTNLNKLADKINTEFNLPYKIKLLIAVSINNYDTKIMFLENILNMSFDCNLNYATNLKNEQSEIKSKEYEFSDIQKYLDKRLNEINCIFNKKSENLSFLLNDSSYRCILNADLRSITQKEYLNENTKCENLIEENLGKKFRNCIKAFNYNLKYYELLLKEVKKEENKIKNEKNIIKNEEKKEQNIEEKNDKNNEEQKGKNNKEKKKQNIEEKNEQNNKEKKGEKNKEMNEQNNEAIEKFENKVLKSFYSQMFTKIRNNIIKSYKNIFVEKNINKLNIMENIVSNLILLREYIYEERTLNFIELQIMMKLIPLKYITINLVYSEDTPDIDYESGDFRFTLSYSNLFFQHAINKIISNNANTNIEGSGFGLKFEKKLIINFVI